MPTTEKPFSVYELERVKRVINSSYERDEPLDYEVKVDGLTVIPRTDDPEAFETITDHVSQRHTIELEIRVYRGKSQHNETTILYFEHNRKPAAQSGATLEGVRDQLRLEFEQEKREMQREWEYRQLQEKYENLSDDHNELQDHAKEMEKELEELRSKKLHLGDVNLLEVGGVVLEGMVRRNPQILAKLPGGQALAGVIEEDNMEKARQMQQESQPKAAPDLGFEFADDSPKINPEDQQYLDLLKRLQATFAPETFLQVMMMLDQFAESPELIGRVETFLQSTQEPEPNTAQEADTDNNNSNPFDDAEL